MRIAVVVGTRPEIIKMAPVIRELESKRVDFFILHTGQHYSYDLDRVFFEQLKLPTARHNLEVGSCSHAEQTARILTGVEKALLEEGVDLILVEGDTNSVLGGALAAAKLHVAVGHVEAGLRSYDRSMPEEINRILTDHCADYLFAPTHTAQTILLSEGIAKERVFVTGNTIVDAVRQNLDLAEQASHLLHDLALESDGYCLVTLHRQENVDNASRLSSIVHGLETVADRLAVPVIWPIHPHAARRMTEFDISTRRVRAIDPVDYLVFLHLLQNARLVLTDSGGVQEESCILGVPCVTLRDNTERPETLRIGSNMLAGAEPVRIVQCAEAMLGNKNSWENPFGDGRAAKRIVEIVMDRQLPTT